MLHPMILQRQSAIGPHSVHALFGPRAGAGHFALRLTPAALRLTPAAFRAERVIATACDGTVLLDASR
jgi:hypothetical protein